MKICILGCGFVGSKLAHHFKSKGDVVTTTTTSPTKVSALEEISNQVVLLDDKSSFKQILAYQDVLIVTVAPKEGMSYITAYLEVAKKVQEGLKENRSVKHLIYTSSCSVYGEKEGIWVTEAEPLEPVNENQQILIEAEKIYLNQLPPSIKVSILRLGEIYGLEKSMEEKVKALSDSQRAVYGESYANLIHVFDIIRAIDFSIHSEVGGVFNLCNDSHLTRKELYGKWCDFLKLPPPRFDSEQKSTHRGNKKVSNQKIKLMGFRFAHPDAEPSCSID